MFESVRVRQAGGFLACDVPLSLALLERTYLLPKQGAEEGFSAALIDLLRSDPLAYAPWARSFAVAPGETARAVERALRDLMMATTTLRPGAVDPAGLDPSSRAAQHLGALRDVWVALGDALPADLAILRGVLEAEADDAVEPLHVIHDPADCDLSAIERAVIAVLRQRHGEPNDISARRTTLTAAREQCHADAGSALGHVQRHLLEPRVTPLPVDDSVRVFGVRDSEAEAHVAASLAQRWLDADASLSAGDIGLLIPEGNVYVPFVREAFGRAGIPLSGLPAGARLRDLAGETLLHTVLALRPQAPAMARASLLRLALMPWSAAAGRALSEAVMAGERRLERFAVLDRRGKAVLRLLADRPAGPHALADVIESLSRHLSADPAVADDVAAFGELAAVQVASLRTLAASAEIPWEDVVARIPVAAAKAAEPGPQLKDAITLMVDGEAPRRPVRHLIALGFSEGTFPVPPGINPLFLDSEIATIRETCGLVLTSRQQVLERRLATLQRQLRVASESLSVFVPWRDLAGARIAPSASLCLMARCFAGTEEPERLITDLSEEDEGPTAALPRAPETKGLPLAPILVPQEVSLGSNLLALRTDAEGQMLSQSPSRLDKLLVSPLAWLLNELDIADAPWAPEALDMLTVGSLFHKVAEMLFIPGAPVPNDAAITARVPDLLGDAIKEIAPFLLSGLWTVERQRLEREFTVSALAWSRTLLALGAEIVANEQRLSGRALGIPCRGSADTLLRLPDDSLVIVDHKTSGAGGRRTRMENGWDFQVEIYRTLAGQPDAGIPGLETKSARRKPIAVAYHTTRDGTLLLHGLDLKNRPAGVEVIVEDIGAIALGRLDAELKALAKGRLRLPEEATLKTMEKAGVRPYALEDSPLVAAFVRDAAREDGDDA
ncbi:PD-(D/E)XK nuclease family protein [Xanthobacter autotrophicus]|uniref:PD-(D/E)XK nuclease family protein n=1 Tax=Xanthobacter autotrophicus TaxID=280 RepID=UPI00372AC7E6